MSDSARVLLTAAVLSASAVATFAWRVTRHPADQPERLIGELRLAQWVAVLLAAIGGASVGQAVANTGVPTSHLDLAIGVGFVMVAGVILLRGPREGLLIAIGGFLVHALFDIGHRPNWLSPDLAPHWYSIGSAAYDIVIAAICYGARRR